MASILSRPQCVNSLVPGDSGSDFQNAFITSVFLIDIFRSSSESVATWMSQDLTLYKSTLLQVMPDGTKPLPPGINLSRCWPRAISRYWQKSLILVILKMHNPSLSTHWGRDKMAVILQTICSMLLTFFLNYRYLRACKNDFKLYCHLRGWHNATCLFMYNLIALIMFVNVQEVCIPFVPLLLADKHSHGENRLLQ